MARKIDLTKSPDSHCPRFQQCSINKCCLCRDYENLKNDPSDPSKQHKEKCTSKNIRKEIGKAFGLKFGGMTTREFNGAKRFGSTNTPQNDIKSNLHVEKGKDTPKNVSGGRCEGEVETL